VKLSVALPVLDCEQTVRTAIVPILGQTYGDWELLIMGLFERFIASALFDRRFKYRATLPALCVGRQLGQMS
jgi:hypothetical protein